MVINQAIPWWVIAGPTFDVVVFLGMEKKKKKDTTESHTGNYVLYIFASQ